MNKLMLLKCKKTPNIKNKTYNEKKHTHKAYDNL